MDVQKVIDEIKSALKDKYVVEKIHADNFRGTGYLVIAVTEKKEDKGFEEYMKKNFPEVTL